MAQQQTPARPLPDAGSSSCTTVAVCCLCLPMSMMGAAPVAAVQPVCLPGTTAGPPGCHATLTGWCVSLSPPCQLQNFQAIIAFAVAVFNSYRLAELLPLVSALRHARTRWYKRTHAMTPQTPLLCVACLPQLPLVACLALLSAFPDWVLQRVDSGAEWMMSIMLGESLWRDGFSWQHTPAHSVWMRPP